MLVCFGTIFFLPDLSESLRNMESLNRVQKQVQDTAEGFLLPPPPLAEAGVDGYFRHDANQIEDPHLAMDRQKLLDKVRSAALPPPLAKPRQRFEDEPDPREANYVDVAVVPPEKSVLPKPGVIAAPLPASKQVSQVPALQVAGEDPDPEIRARRDTVKKVGTGGSRLE